MRFEQRLEGGGVGQNGDQVAGAEGKESGQNEILLLREKNQNRQKQKTIPTYQLSVMDFWISKLHIW